MALTQRLLGGTGGTNQTDKIVEQLLENAGPEATQTYQRMLKGLLKFDRLWTRQWRSAS